jgi:DNA repair exonuclease SbcCD ATPase subunit
MKILKLKLENFQGIKSAEFDFNGNSADIFGDNAVGKTTIQNAHCWLLFGRSGDNVKGYTPKTNDSTGGYMHNLEHAAEETLQLDDGRVITYRRVYKEVYKKKRGSAQTEFDGHTLDYYINGVPVSEKEYNASVTALTGGDADRLKILTIPDYFPCELPWQNRRQILLELCGDVSFDDVISSTTELEELSTYLRIPGTYEMYSVDEYLKIAKAKKTDINKLLNAIPARIDEANRATPDISELDAEAIRTEITALRAQQAEAEQERAASKSSGSAAQEARLARQTAESELITAKNKYLEDAQKKNAGIIKTIDELSKEISAARYQKTVIQSDINTLGNEIVNMELRRSDLLRQYEIESKKVWDPNNEVCPTCKRQLPAEDIERHRSEFNLEKSKKLEDIRRQGTAVSQEKIAAVREKQAEKQTEYDVLTTKITGLEQQISEARTSMDTIQFESTDEYKALSEAVAARKQAEIEAAAGNSGNDAAYQEKISALSSQIRERETKLINIETAKRQRERIAELQEEEKKLSEEYEMLEAGTYLCEVFIKQKVRLLTDSINSRFKSVRFRLFVEQINGGLREDCEVMIPSPSGKLVPYSTANDAAKINAGIEIINALSEHWRIRAPLFVDNAERITRMNNIDTQTVRLVVSERDKTLRMELYDDAAETVA